MLRLGVNIDHVATVRQARYRPPFQPGAWPEPDPVEVAKLCILAGAHSITAHLREDRRHIQEYDIERLKSEVSAPLNLEMATTDAMISFALQHQPAEVCLVPEKREELTTEGGLDVVGHEAKIKNAVATLENKGIQVSLFVDPDVEQIDAVGRTGARCLELHTGSYANAAPGYAREACLKKLIEASIHANSLGIQVNAGHGLRLSNLPDFLKTPHLNTLNIGHSIISRSILVGIQNSIKDLLTVMTTYSGLRHG